MSASDELKQKRPVLTRREFLTRPFGWLVLKPSPPWREGALPGLIPLSALRDIPEAALMSMVPVLRRGWRARICDAGIAYQDDSGQVGTVSLSPECCAAARLFDGVRTLEQAAADLDAEPGMTPGNGRSVVRETFLTLAMREIYHPNAPMCSLKEPPPVEDQHA